MGRKIPVARVARAHGLRGEVRLLPYLLQNQELLVRLPRFFRRRGSSFEPLFPESRRDAPGGGILIRFRGVEDRAGAEALRGLELFADQDDLPEPEEGEFYVFELVGLEVRLTDGRSLGRVVGLMPVGPYDLLEVRTAEGETFYLPLVEEMVEEISPARGVVVVRPQEGLIEVQLRS